MRVLVASIINQIRQNLRDRYKSGFPIIKELIQNADDAFANRIDLIFSPGISNADNPLLKGPALVILNDGQFDEKNARALNCIGLSSKAGNPNAVGRYGLGLKSVFHLCESFFFLSDIDESLHIVNPWAELDGPDKEIDGVYPDWDTLTASDYKYILGNLKPVLESYSNFLCIWIPLRKGTHFDRRHPIVREVPGDTGIDIEKIINPVGNSAGLVNELGRLFPQLRNLERLNLWRLNNNKNAEIILDLTLGTNSTRLAFPKDTIEPNKPRQFQGYLALQSNNKKTTRIEFAGVEKFLEEPIFRSLQNSDLWPKHSNEDPITHLLIEQSDNAKPHSAAVFSRFPILGNAMLGISRAVFLPLEKQFELIQIDGGLGFGLTLHGWFFVDAGRTELPGWDRDYLLPINTSEELTLSWNGALAQKGTLQAVIPALDHFVKTLNLTLSGVYNLTFALKNSVLFNNYGKFICEKDQWVYSYDPDGSKWICVPSNRKVLELPAPPVSNPDRPSKIFPRITEVGLVTLEGMPRLASNTTLNSWSQNDLIKLLSSIPIQKVFSNQGMLDYLVKVLEKALQDPNLRPITDNPGLSGVILKITREAFSSIDLKKMDENRSLIKKICGLIPAESRFSIKGEDEELRKPDSILVLKNLFQLQIDLLITPANFDGPPSSNSYLLLKHGEAILRAVANDSQSGEPSRAEDIRSRIALQVFDSYLDPHALIQKCGSLRLFKGVKYIKGSAQEVSLSLTELKDFSTRELLFQYTIDGTRSDQIVRDLSIALEGIQPVIIKKEINASLKLHASESNAIGCLRLLESRPNLTTPAERKDLIRNLLGAMDMNLENAQRERLGNILRFVFHGQANHDGYSGFLYTQDGERKVPQILAKIILQSKAEEWLVLDPEFSQVLTPDMCQKLKITELGETSALSLLDSLSEEKLSFLEFSEVADSDRNKIIIFLYQHSRKELLRNIKIHEKQGGDLVSVTRNTFFESSFTIPKELSSDAVLLKIPADNLLPAVYTELGVIPLSADATIRLAVSKEHPEQYWRLIMDALPGLEKQTDSIAVRSLRECPWLPTVNHEVVKPVQVLHVPGLENEITSLLSEFNSGFVSSSHLPKEFVSHSSWRLFSRSVLSGVAEVVSQLGMLASELEKYRIGDLNRESVNESFYHVFQYVFEQTRGFDILPASPIISKIGATFNPDLAIKFTEKLCKPISSDRLVNVMNHLSTVHESAPRDKKDSVLSLFESYIASISGRPEIRDSILPKIRLINKNKKWKSTNNLVYDAKGIDAEDLLDQRHGKILELKPGANSNHVTPSEDVADANDYERDLAAGAKQLLAYFMEWEPYIQNKEILGGFLSLLGDQRDLLRQAQSYLGKRDVNETREILEWMTENTPTFHSGESVNNRLQRQSFFIRIVESQTKKVIINSITGEEFEANLLSEESLEHLLYDANSSSRPTPPSIGGKGRVYDYICLRKIRLEEAIPGRLIDLLKKTARIILREVYYQDIRNFDEFWQELEQSDQFDIEIAQDTIIETAFSYIPTLGLATHEKFRPRIKAWEDIRNKEVQARHNAIRKKLELSHSFEKERDKLRSSLKSLLESSELEGQAEKDELLNAIRYKIGQEYQYKYSSILFELFQNADDAIAELDVLFREVRSKNFTGMENNHPDIADSFLNDHHRRVVVDWSPEYVRLAHWGRAINQIHPGSGEFYGYGDDLVKMLMMQRSDKLIATQLDIKPLTGKFGLGFKSVFLISRKPSILSGRIKFEIVAGLYPLRMSVDKLTLLSNILEGWGDSSLKDGTLVELPIDLDGIPNISTEKIINYFYQWADLLVIFSHEINKIELRRNGQVIRVIEWQPQKIYKDSTWSLGKLQNVDRVNKSYLTNALVWKTTKSDIPENDSNGKVSKDSQGSLLITLGPDGCVPLASGTPSIWVTAPTEEIYPVGFALNGNFALDVGRAQLARTSANNRLLAQDLGRKFGDALLELFNYLHTNWAGFCQQAGLKPETTPYDFWESLWKITLEPMQKADSRDGYELLHGFLGQAGGGFDRLYKNASALPSGLPSEYKILTKLNDVQFYVSGILENDEIFAKVTAGWPVFQEKVPIGSAISSSVRNILFHLLSEKPDLFEINLWKIVNWIIGPSSQVSPAQADLMGKIITPAFVNNLERAEEETLRQYLKQLKFMTLTGKFYNIIELLAKNIENNSDYQDEFLRSQFAPDELVLSNEYSGVGNQFFRACREKLSAPVEKLAGWALDVKSSSGRKAFLNYLLRGELGSNVAETLLSPSRQSVFDGSWLSYLSEEDELIQDFNIHECQIIFGRLHISTDTPEEPGKTLPPAKVILDKIYTWWEENQGVLIADYERNLYPYGKPPVLSSDEEFTGDTDERREWMILFLLGSYHRIGRLRMSTYRDFIEHCDEKGWLNIFAKKDSQAQEWIDVLQQYIEHISDDNDAKHQNLFMQQFVNIYKLSLDLPSYVEIFLSINRVKDRFNIDQITNPNESELFSGSGLPMLPKLSNTLGIGTGLVLRELFRHGVIKSKHAIEHCYPPVKRVEMLFKDMGCYLDDGPRILHTTQIYDFLVKHLGKEKATFLNSFDIPFLTIADQYESLYEFLEQNG